MKKLTIKKIIAFREKGEKAKKNFVADLKVDKEKDPDDSIRDYWIFALSAISNAYKENNLEFIQDKISELEEKLDDTEYEPTKIMYQRNIDILYNYESFDFTKWQPSEEITFLKKQKSGSILNIKGLMVQASPHHVFTFENDGDKQVGAIWFVTKLSGFRKDELGMFADLLYKYLVENYSDNYVVNTELCMVVNIAEATAISYSQLERKKVPKVLTKLVSEIRSLM